MKSLSSICFGCEPLGGADWGEVNVNSIERAIHTALDLGVNFFDTAGVYGLGLSEERLSNILGSCRHDVVIATKGGLSWRESCSDRAIVTKDSSPSAIRRDVEDSLRRLRLDVLPIFFIHWPDPRTPIEETFFELLKLKEEGLIRLIGCSNFSSQQVSKACETCQIDYIQMPLNILGGALGRDMLDVCARNRIRVVAYNVLANGLLTGKYDKYSTFPDSDRRSRLPMFKGAKFQNALKEIDRLKIEAEKDNSSLLQHAINWSLNQEYVSSVILGIKTPEQIKDNWSAVVS